jgi:hypothetical protein
MSFFSFSQKKKGVIIISLLLHYWEPPQWLSFLFFNPKKDTPSSITRKYILNPKKEMEEVECTIMDDDIVAHPLLRKTRYNFLG